MIKTKTGRTVLFAASLLTGFLPVDWPEIFCINKAVAMLKYFMLGVFLLNGPLARFGEENTGNDSGLRPARPVRMHLARPKRHTHRPDGLYIAICRHPYDMRDIGTDQKPETYNAKTPCRIGLFLYHLSVPHHHRRIRQTLVQQVPLLANGNDPLYFSVGAAAVIGAGIFLPIILHRYILQRNRLLRFLFGLKPAK